MTGGDDEFDDGKLFKLVLTHLEQQSYVRAPRIQSIHSFYWSLLVAFILSVGIGVEAELVDCLGIVPT